ncbi:hypothetical protein [Paractinoplanes hotanensis]|uniref:Uncharacterized protein n=1 Tax=Paractinoplanes hotanensis TaxID=2906497 RepID=A0ABT0YD66_9ACTN|nr:hypothetical protein [Actinoplanes hotanensis]MCM4083433.1 hypothetical protein [Actinoplanes hotanensis]
MADREVTPGSGLHREPPAPLDGVTPEPIDGVAGAMRWFATERNTLETVVADPPVVGFATWQLVESMVPF